MKGFRTVLIVDDSATSRMIIQRCVEMCGFEIGAFVEAENGIDGLTALDGADTVDLIFSDINMPKMDGTTFIKLVKNKGATAGIPIVVTSSVALSAVESGLKRLGVTGVIQKPVSPEKVLAVLGGLS